MPPSDFRLPDDFPDLSLPERSEPVREPSAPTPRPAPTPWKAGDRVLAPWEPNCLYVGRIAQIKDGQALIEFDDGDAGWVSVDRVRALTVPVGQKVFSRRRMGPQFFPGEILEVRGDEVLVGFADDQHEEWVGIAALRIPCQPTGPAATPVKVASHMAFAQHLQPGDRVWAPWSSTTLFVGTVDRIEGKEVHIHFDDGDRGWVQLEQVVPLQIPVGLRIMGRWRMRSQYYPGMVTDVQGDRIHIQYDDGDKEWTRPAALALPCERFGPDARPTRGSVNPSAVLGWVVPILIAIVLVCLRAGCR
jgi:hypothetical protein